jgi:hypothetical protein
MSDRGASDLQSVMDGEAEKGRTARALGITAGTANFHNYRLDAPSSILSDHVMLERTGEGDYLIFYSRAKSLAAANQAFVESTSRLDEATKAIIQETWDVARATRLDVLIDIARA